MGGRLCEAVSVVPRILEVVLTSTKPTQMWTFHDASASTKSVQATLLASVPCGTNCKQHNDLPSERIRTWQRSPRPTRIAVNSFRAPETPETVYP
eukprot:3915409-Amphidinium_carterae.1